MPEEITDDTVTLIALGILAFALADVSHEALGHGLAVLATGAHPIILTTTYFTADGTNSRWVPAAGGLANAAVGLLSLGTLRLFPVLKPHLQFFLILSAAFNLMFAAGYPAYSGIAAFGDWAAVISGLSPAWLWRVLLVVMSVIAYYFSMRLIAIELRPFYRSGLARLRRITLIPYLAALAIAGLAGALNPMGWTVLFTAALPAGAAAFGLTQMDHFVDKRTMTSLPHAAGAITRSVAWIAAAAVVAIVFVGLLGPGIRFAAVR